MPGNALKALSFAAAAGTFAGLAYTALALARVRGFRNLQRKRRGSLPTPLTMLKPLCGLEPNLFENLCSFCDQEYGPYQVVFGAADHADPALEIARAVAARFPDRDIEILSGNAQPAGNPKIGNLLGMIGRARNPIIVIADSDICVGRDYAQAVASCFDDPHTGAATCAYGGTPRASFASRLGALHVNDHFSPSVLVAAALEPLTYCLGATMAVRAGVLNEIGGLAALADCLADDYVLGKLVADRGYRVALVPYAVQTSVSDDSLSALWRHELRWARAIRGQRPAGYAGSIVTYVLPFAATFALTSRTALSSVALVLAATLRVLLHLEAREAFAPRTPAAPWLIPLREAFGVAVWAGSFCGTRVEWKNDRYHLTAGGRMARAQGKCNDCV